MTIVHNSQDGYINQHQLEICQIENIISDYKEISANTSVIPLSTDEDTVNIERLFFIININSRKKKRKQNNQYFNFVSQI